MATLRLKFPEKNEPSILALSGSRVTLGRLPLNTIQIIDRTLSGFHAEFVLEEDHYRLHDRGSTNGTFVNGETVTDFHLREACKVAFGGLECEYSPESPTPADTANVEALPTRSEINAVRQENAELRTRIDSLQAEIETLNKTRGAETGAGTIAVAKDEYEKVLAERDALKETQRTGAQEIEQLKSDLSQLQRDRESLQRVADDAKAEIAGLTPEPSTPEAPEPAPAPPAAEPEAAPTVSVTPNLPFPAPSAPSTPSELPKPSFPLPMAKPTMKPPTSLPGVPGKFPVAASATPRVIPAPVARPVATPPAPAGTGTVSPSAGLKPMPRPLTKAPSSAMKGGTQKIDTDAAAKPATPTVKPMLKPPVKLPLQPTVRLQPGVKPSLPSEDKSKG